MKKKAIFTLLTPVFALGCALGMAACNSEKEVFTYKLSDDGSYYSITEIQLSEECNLIIPSEHEGKPVKRIEEYAAYGLHSYDQSKIDKSKIQTLTVPNSINYIGDKALWGIQKVIFGDYKDAELTTHDSSIQPYSLYIGERAFQYYRGASLELPENVYLALNAFYGGQYKNVTFKGKIAVKTDGSYSLNAFYGAAKIEAIELPEATAAYNAHLSNFVDGYSTATVNSTYSLPLKYVVIPGCVKLDNSWVGRTLIGGSDVKPPKLYLKIGQSDSTSELARTLPAKTKEVHQTGCPTMRFGDFVYYYSEERPAGNGLWHYADGTPTEW